MKQRRIWLLIRIFVLVLAAFAFNFPLIATVITSLKSEAEIGGNPTLSIDAPTFENYRAIRAVADRFDLFHYLSNSFVAAGLGAFLALALSLPAAYAIARAGMGSRWMLPICANLRAIPLIIFAIPIYLVYQRAGLLDTRIGLALILCLVNVPLAVVLLANFLREMPIAIEEAARMDGASTLGLLWHIVLPLSAPIVASALILSFIYGWNEYLFGLMLTTQRAVPISVGASFFFSASGGGIRWGVASAVMVLSVLPPMLVGLFAYRFIGQALAAGAVKE